MRFDNMRDAVQKLQGTMVTHKGKAFLIEEIDVDLQLLGRYVVTDKVGKVQQDDPFLNFFAGELGYVNTDREALYCMRVPRRRWKQGIDLQGIIFPADGIRARARVDYKELAHCLEGDYPKLDIAMGLFECRNPFKPDARKSVAFSRHFAVGKGEDGGMLLRYKGRRVGVVENNRAILSAENIWLNELLEEEL